MITTETKGHDLGSIERLCAELDGAATYLETLTSDLQADLEEVKTKHLRGLKRQASVVARAEAALMSAVESAPHLFEKPRTITIHGVRVGFSVSKGKVEWDDEDSVIAAIRKYRKDDLDVLLQTVESPRKDALRALPAGDLARLGCRITGAGDQVLVKRVAGDVEQLIAKLTQQLLAKMVAAED